jgi:hypothetical protein
MPKGWWREAEFQRPLEAESDVADQMKVGLLGDRLRRGRIDRTIALNVDAQVVQDALTQTAKCSVINGRR